MFILPSKAAMTATVIIMLVMLAGALTYAFEDKTSVIVKTEITTRTVTTTMGFTVSRNSSNGSCPTGYVNWWNDDFFSSKCYLRNALLITTSTSNGALSGNQAHVTSVELVGNNTIVGFSPSTASCESNSVSSLKLPASMFTTIHLNNTIVFYYHFNAIVSTIAWYNGTVISRFTSQACLFSFVPPIQVLP